MTLLLSASDYLTHGNIRFCFLIIIENLKTHFSNEEFTQSTVANSIYHKLKEYWLIIDESSQISALLDSCIKLIAFDNNDEKKKVKDLILELTEYYEVSQVQITDNATTGDKIINTYNYFCHLQIGRASC